MKKFNFIVLISAVLLTLGVSACKTTEKNYREAYEKATADNGRNVTDFENTIYNRYRAQTRDIKVDVNGREVTTRSAYVRVTPEGGGIGEWLKQYSVVVAEFKQLFNAKSMRQRFADAGYPRAFLVENAEPYYYVIVDSSNDIAQMLAVADSLKSNSPVPLKTDFPYILQLPNRR